MNRLTYILSSRLILCLAIATALPGIAQAGIFKKLKHPQPAPPLEIPAPPAAPPTPGSLWTPGGAFNDLAADYKARNLNDLIAIQIVENTTGSAAGTMDSERSMTASSGLTGLVGKLGANNNLQNLLGASSSSVSTGKGSATTTTTLNTQITGRVVQVLSNGNLLVEARREVEINHEKQTAILRCLVRPGDITPSNTVLSTQVSDLSVSIGGKGVVNDAVRQPMSLVRLVLHLFSF